ncbi:glycosyltransferase family 64 protein [Cercospora zeae-maydis SCOH1-5]|uniref:Glycosyltransferase family 64 protein n=1 Tax=Cercospora zeae-maydis SCOH1-5 TaxID=717836 RepID=A0A6A6F993_9PEZI|nr:glycosyltransferase family 64 protein [Cercospora zeae-maydis SCOH1-5]
MRNPAGQTGNELLRDEKQALGHAVINLDVLSISIPLLVESRMCSGKVGKDVDRGRGSVEVDHLCQGIVSPTYRRLQSLPKFLGNYANGNLTSLRKVMLLWNEIENDPPASFLESLGTYNVPVILEQRHVTSLSQSFHPSGNVNTNCVFLVEDDVILKPEDIDSEYQVWKKQTKGRQRMLNFVAREARKQQQQLIYNQPREEYHMALTKAAFYHTDWMKAYWADDAVTTSLRENEDILVSFLRALFARVPPISVRPEVMIDFGGSDGISSGKGHLVYR